MSTPYLGEMRMFGANYAPVKWSFCDGSLLPKNQNGALFDLLDATYGGNGHTDFALPDLRGRIPIKYGSRPKSTPRKLGEKGGTETVTLQTSQLPAHSHQLMASAKPGTELTPTSNLLAATTLEIYKNDPSVENIVSLHHATIENHGGGLFHTNMQPFLCLNFIISLHGIYPPRHADK